MLEYVARSGGLSISSQTLVICSERLKLLQYVLNKKHGKLNKIQQLSSVTELEKLLLDIKDRYEQQHDNNKIGRWLSRLSSRICHYGRILDVLVQHHPEYVSLAWGAMKFLFIVCTCQTQWGYD